jgi:hypothetical protein
MNTFLNVLSGLLEFVGMLFGANSKIPNDDPLMRTPDPYEMSHPTWSVHWDD